MDIGYIMIIVYCIVGLILEFRWFDKEYKTLEENNGEVENGMVSILLLTMVVLWPIKLVYNLIRFRKI